MYHLKRAFSVSEVTMFQNKLWRWTQMATLAATLAVGLGSIAWAQDRDDYNYRHDQAREQGYKRGYDDGARAGQSDRERGRRFNFKNDDWEDSRGYEHWMGSKGRYKSAYRDGYEQGYRRAYSGDRRDWDHDRDDRNRHDRDDWR